MVGKTLGDVDAEALLYMKAAMILKVVGKACADTQF